MSFARVLATRPFPCFARNRVFRATPSGEGGVSLRRSCARVLQEQSKGRRDWSWTEAKGRAWTGGLNRTYCAHQRYRGDFEAMTAMIFHAGESEGFLEHIEEQVPPIDQHRRILGIHYCRGYDLQFVQDLIYDRTGIRPMWTGKRRTKSALYMQISEKNFTSREHMPAFAARPDKGHVKDFFLFREGTLISFGASYADVYSLIELIQSTEIEPFERYYHDQISFSYMPRSGMDFPQDIVHLSGPDAYLEKLTSAYCMYRSLLLEQLEHQAESICKDVSTQASAFFLHHGSLVSYFRLRALFMHAPNILTQPQVLTMLGIILKINSELNDDKLKNPPEYLWDSPQFERLYELLQRSFMLRSRLNSCNQLLETARKDMELVRDHLNIKHSSWLEWIIIVLIAVEVGFILLEKSEYWKTFTWEKWAKKNLSSFIQSDDEVAEE